MLANPAGVTRVPSIPVVDFAGFADGDAADRRAAATGVRRALEEFGFAYLKSHGVPQPTLDTVFAQLRWFFARPAAVKNAVKWMSAASNRGYIPPVGQSLDENKPFDLKEAYQAGYDEHPAGNLWPAGNPAFREAVLAFQDAAVAACERLMEAIALAYGLPHDYFAPFFAGPWSTTRLLHYPPVDRPPLPGQVRAGAHTDFAALTLLFHQSDADGLEIQHPDGTWLPAPPLPGAAIVNTGDLMQRWTNDLVRSSPHRVVNPVGEAAARARYSVALFYGPRRDAVIECLAPCQGPDRPPRYPPITAGEHVIARTKATHKSAD